MDFGQSLAKESPLGKDQQYKHQYDASLLYALPRALGRKPLNIDTKLPFFGADVWTAYELSWLDILGKPCVAVAELLIPCESPNLVESKSLKLYFNSFYDTQFQSSSDVRECIEADLSKVCGAPVQVNLMPPSQWEHIHRSSARGICLDGIELACTDYQVTPDLLTCGTGTVSERVFTRLFRSNCLVTGQPDWANIEIAYSGPQIDHSRLLRYLVSYRSHQGFHEQCVEHIFVDLMERCKPTMLTVIGTFTRRGGIDINPYRSTDSSPLVIERHPRQ